MAILPRAIPILFCCVFLSFVRPADTQQEMLDIIIKDTAQMFNGNDIDRAIVTSLESNENNSTTTITTPKLDVNTGDNIVNSTTVPTTTRLPNNVIIQILNGMPEETHLSQSPYQG